MDKKELVELMTPLLQALLDESARTRGEAAVSASADTPLVGRDSSITSLDLVSFLSDVEMTLAEKLDLPVTLVDERALSRRRSPFRSIDALSEYILELTGPAASA